MVENHNRKGTRPHGKNMLNAREKHQTEKEALRMESHRCTRSSPRSMSSTPASLYDFMEDSPACDASRKSSAKNVHPITKKQTKPSNTKNARKKQNDSLPKGKQKELTDSNSTPKGGVSVPPTMLNTATVNQAENKPVRSKQKAWKDSNSTPKGGVSLPPKMLNTATVNEAENKPTRSKHKELKDSNSTPKGVSCVPPKMLKTEILDEADKKPISKRIRALKPIPPANFDDISPILKDKSVTPSRKRAAHVKNDLKENRKKRKSSKGSPSLPTPVVSFMESSEENDANDSAIFVSPRKTMPRFSTGKTSTPTDVPARSKAKTARNMKKHKVKQTSTPVLVENKPQPGYTGLKPNISPVQTVDTPTSDYASMDSISSTEATPTVETTGDKRIFCPAFSMEDDDSGELLQLNRSVNKSYKKSKKKMTSATFRVGTSKIEEWAEKVNSELEDIEQFELSVEG